MLNKWVVGIWLLGLVLILTSLHQIILIPNYYQYCQINHEFSLKLMPFRYVFSYGLRLAGFLCGVGLLFRRDIVRRVCVWLCLVSIMTLPFRHTYQNMLHYTAPLFVNNHNKISWATIESFTWISVIIRWLIEGLFAVLMVYFLTRKNVKDSFI